MGYISYIIYKRQCLEDVFFYDEMAPLQKKFKPRFARHDTSNPIIVIHCPLLPSLTAIKTHHTRSYLIAIITRTVLKTKPDMNLMVNVIRIYLLRTSVWGVSFFLVLDRGVEFFFQLDRGG